jgi:hypothetical protein
MIRNLQNLDKQTRYSLFITTFALAVFVMLVLNAVISVGYLLDLIKQPGFQNISLSFKEGYYVINDKKMGVSIVFNLFGILVLWFLMLYHTIRSIYDLDYFLDNFNDYS